MPFTPKKDAAGAVIWKDGKPVYINSDTNGEVEVDVDKLFTDLAAVRHEAADHRQKFEAADLKLKTFVDIDPAKVKTDAAELVRLKAAETAGGLGRSKAPSQEEIDRMVDERFQAKLAEMTTDLEGTKAKLTTSETAREKALGEYRGLKLETEYTRAADAVGIRPECRDDGLRYVREGWKVEDDGTPRKRDVNGKVLAGTDPSKPLSIEEELRVLTGNNGNKRLWLTPAKGTQQFTTPGAAVTAADTTNMSVSELLNTAFASTAP